MGRLNARPQRALEKIWPPRNVLRIMVYQRHCFSGLALQSLGEWGSGGTAAAGSQSGFGLGGGAAPGHSAREAQRLRLRTSTGLVVFSGCSLFGFACLEFNFVVFSFFLDFLKFLVCLLGFPFLVSRCGFPFSDFPWSLAHLNPLCGFVVARRAPKLGAQKSAWARPSHLPSAL